MTGYSLVRKELTIRPAGLNSRSKSAVKEGIFKKSKTPGLEAEFKAIATFKPFHSIAIRPVPRFLGLDIVSSGITWQRQPDLKVTVLPDAVVWVDYTIGEYLSLLVSVNIAIAIAIAIVAIVAIA
ncbi:hypothetical protein DL767_001335 [Monosporascus sp. MG133]|nr:hypothetical protein DL767_001335 [Monosporascus sp. MG133]